MTVAVLLPLWSHRDFPCGSAGKESSSFGLGRFPGEGKGYPLPGLQRVRHDWVTFTSFFIALCCDFPGKNTEVGYHFLLQGNFPTQGLKRSLGSPALSGGFFTTEPPGKPKIFIFQISHCWIFGYSK